MTESEAIKEFQQNIDMPFGSNISREASELAIQALEIIKKLSDRKMTAEVLENYMQFEDECVKKGFTFKSVIEAREKQIPEKPIFANNMMTKDKFLMCPCCKFRFPDSLVFLKTRCWNCGQKLDWSDEE